MSCQSNKEKKQAKEEKKPIEYRLPVPPPTINSSIGRSDYILQNIWKNIPLEDTLVLSQKDLFEQYLVNYISVAFIANNESYRSSISELYERADSTVLNFVKEKFSHYLDDPNSPLKYQMMDIPGADPQKQSTLYYIFAMEAIKSNKTSYADRVIFQDRIELYNKNKPGQKAENFKFINSRGKKGSLWELPKRDLTLLMFYNPGCHSCEQIEAQINNNKLISSLVKDKKLQILMVYPDKNIKLWEKYLENMPSLAIVTRNYDNAINDQSLYDIRAIPTLYLLDQEKNVLLRDAPLELIYKEINERL